MDATTAKKRKKRNAGSSIVIADGIRYRVWPGHPYYHTHTNVDVWKKGLRLDDKVGSLALTSLEQYKAKPFLFFVHFLCHAHSEGHKKNILTIILFESIF